MKILFDGRVLSSKIISGIPEYARILFNNLVNLDRKNEYILFFNSFKKENNLNFIFEDSIKLKIKLLKTNFPNKFLDLSWYFSNFPNILEKSGADLVFNPHFNMFQKTDKIPRITTFHDLSQIKFPEYYSFKKKMWHYIQFSRIQALRSDHIISVSKSTKNDIIDIFKIPEEKISVVYSGVNDIYFEEIPEYEIKKFRISKKIENPFFLFLGTIEPRKNISIIIKAFNILKKKRLFKDFSLLIVGAQGWLYDKILKEASESSYRDEIIFFGQASQKEARMLYKSASLFVFPSFFEGFGFPPLEAQACGLPVISSDAGSLKEILLDSAVLVNPYSLDQLVFSVESVVFNQERINELRNKGLENSKRFNWGKTTKEMINIFEKHKI